MTLDDAFLRQAQSDLRVFEFLLQHPELEACHALHYLQMATEKLAKAVQFAQRGIVTRKHTAISRLAPYLVRREYADKPGYKNKYDSYFAFVRRSTELFVEIERLCPAVADSRSTGDDMPNVEYPWRLPGMKDDWQSPCDFNFSIYSKVRDHADAKQVLHFLKILIERFHEVFF